MTSQYGVVTSQELQNAMGIDLKNYTDSDGNRVFTDDIIDARISKAERRVSIKTTQTWDSSAPFNIKEAVLTLAEWLMKDLMWQHGLLANWERMKEENITAYLEEVVGNEEFEGQFLAITGEEAW